MTTTRSATAEESRDFIRDIITSDLASGKYKEIVADSRRNRTATYTSTTQNRSRSISATQEFPGHCNLRFDDTNPAKEEQKCIDLIQSDVRWLGYDWAGEPFYASDYFDRLYEWAEGLIQRGLAYVDDQSQHDIRVNRGTLTEPGKDSPFRDRSVGKRSRPVPPHEGRRVSEWCARVARQDRHGHRQHQPTRPRAVPHPACASSAHR